MDASRLYCTWATPSPGDWNTSKCCGSEPSAGVKLTERVPLPAKRKSVARYWSPNAWRPMMIGLFHPGTRRGMFEMMIGSRKMTPPRMLRIVPFGLFHIFFRPNSSTRASSGVMVAHLTPTPCFWMAWAASMVT